MTREMKRLSNKAQPGPWAQQNDAPGLIYGPGPDAGGYVCDCGSPTYGADDDARFIVALVNAFRDGLLVEKAGSE